MQYKLIKPISLTINGMKVHRGSLFEARATDKAIKRLVATGDIALPETSTETETEENS